MQQARSRWTRVATALTLAAFLPLSTGCFGNFQLLRKVYGFNEEVDQDRWVQEGVFLLLNIPFIPVYSIAAALDALFFNSVEFWTGEELLTADATRSVTGENGEVASAIFHPDGSVDLTVEEADGTVHTLTLVREDGKLVALDADGAVLARVSPQAIPDDSQTR